MRKGSWRSWAEVKSLVHCRCPAAHSATFAPGRRLHLHVKGPCLSTLYVSLPQEPFVALLSFIISPLSSHFFPLLSPTLSLSESGGREAGGERSGLGGGGVGGWSIRRRGSAGRGWGPHTLSLPSQAERWTGSQAGRKTRLSPVKRHCLCDVT